jgi:2-polyprenyl-3-methyl-5-hydroxy-6-metoxy-1,4-benzoquinol methylase
MMDPVEVKNYWEDRLTKVFSLHGVGYAGLGVRYNRWIYAVRRRVFLRTLKACPPLPAGARVLDIGCGTGFYIDRWKELGVAAVTGMDLTSAAVNNLAKRYPDCTFVKQDIGENVLPEGLGQFDAVSAFDVLFHIVDEERYENALRNIASLLKPGGLFIHSDNFLHGSAITIGHQSSRSLADIEKKLDAAGFDIISRRPMLYLMNDPIDGTHPWVRLFWKVQARVISVHELAGWIVGCLLYPVELLLTKATSESPTTEIMVCRKRTVIRSINI